MTSAKTALSSTALAGALVVTLFAGAAAQVATLRTPDPDAEPSPAAEEADVEGEEALLAFAGCMRDNGIDMDDPQFDGGGGFFGRRAGAGAAFDLDSSEFQAAFETCGPFLAAVRPDLDPEQQAEQAEARVMLAQCMRDRDYDFPDPDPDGGFGFGPEVRDALNAGDPEFVADFQACQQETSFGFGAGGPGGDGGVAD
jgi:hypothetical protein